MRYYSTIIFFFILSIFAIVSLLYLSNITRKIEKENYKLIKQIDYTRDQININEIEYSLFNSYEYLQKMQKIYFDKIPNINLNNRISFNKLKNKNIENFYTVSAK